MKRLLLTLALFLLPSATWAQCNGVFPANTVCGNLTGSPAIPSAQTAVGTIVVGPVSSVVGDAAVWNNTVGTLLKDVPFLQVYGTQSANTFLSGPSSGAVAFPTWRAIVAADLPAGVPSNTLRTVTSGPDTVLTTDCGKVLQEGTGSSGLWTITLPAVGSFSGVCVVSIYNGDTTSLNSKLLSGFPTNCWVAANYGIFPGQMLQVEIINGAWQVSSCPGLYSPRTAMTLFIDNSGSDSLGDGTAGSPFATMQKCISLYEQAVFYPIGLTQPTCSHTASQTITESATHVVPIPGTNTLNITGNGAAFTWKPSGSNPHVLLLGNGANIQLAQTIFSGASATCFSSVPLPCVLFKIHNNGIFETVAATVQCDNTGSGGFCIGSDQNTQGGAQFNINNGLVLSGTIGSVFDFNGGARLLFNGTLLASGGPTISQIVGARGLSSVVFAGNFLTGGSFGAARQWAILNGAILCNSSGTAIPGSTAGINTAATFAAGVIVNSGVSAGGC